MTNAGDSAKTSKPNGTGKLAVLAMIAVALVAATFAWWWNFNRGRKTLAFFGPQAARLIRTAPKVEILVVGETRSILPSTDQADILAVVQSTGWPNSTDDYALIGNILVPVYKRIDISKAPGLIHARASLLTDSSYTGETTLTAWGDFTEVVRFADDDGEFFLAFSKQQPDLHVVAETKAMRLIPKTADGWRQFIERNVKQAEAATSAGSATPPAPAHKVPSE